MRAKEFIVESAYEEAWELISQPVPEIQQFVKELGLLQNKESAEKISSLIDAVTEKEIPASSIPKLKNLANKGNDVQTLQSIIKISGQPNAAEQYAKLMKARDAGEKRNRGYDVSDLVNSIKLGNYEAPVLLQLPTGLYVIGGRTRLYAALALNVPAKVKIISADTFKQKLDEVPLPPDWDPNQMALRKPFKDRMKYVRGMSPKIGHGSSREVRIVNYEGRPTALKVAKNLRGLAQNEEEIKILNDGYLGRLPIVIPLIDYDKENRRPVWLQTEVASKVNAQTLKNLLRTPNMWMLTDTVEVMLGKSKKYRPNTTVDSLKEYYFNPKTWNGIQPTEDMYEIFMDYVTDIATIYDSTNIELADLQDPSNWGQFHGRPVILDLGLTNDVWQKYYKK